MNNTFDLSRFVEAHKQSYETALKATPHKDRLAA